MAIYRGAGGAGDAVADSSSEALLVRQLAVEVQADADAAEAARVAAVAAKVAAETAETNAEIAETNAELAETNAETAQAAAASSASAASTSATNAASSASSASTSATNAANSATAASNSASAASTSATNAASSASSASASASTATTQATNAANSASAAATSATNASNSASAAATSATNAATSATSASNSASTATTQATNAANSATAAATSATNSANSATASASSATDSAASATLANDWATKTSAPVAGGEYSAKYHAQQSATSATNASNSASSAATSATNASNSATASASSASDAAASAAAAAASYDNFDDRYLGSKSSAPTLDNDGNALLTGALYYNNGTVTPADKGMYVYDGSQWIAASAASTAILTVYKYTATAGQTTFSGNDDNAVSLVYTAGSVIITLNGVVLEIPSEVTASSGTSVVLSTGAVAGDELNIYAFATFNVANTYTQAQSDATFLTKSNPSYTGTLTGGTGVVNIGSGHVYKDASGNLGIGTSSPVSIAGYTIQTLNNGTSGSGTYYQQAATSIGRVLVTSSEMYVGTNGAYPLLFQTNAAERMRITSSGDVGIGTSSPNTKLETVGTMRVSRSGSPGTYMEMFGGSGAFDPYINVPSGFGIPFHVGGTERMRIDSSGHFIQGAGCRIYSIGTYNLTTAAAANLNVDGNGTFFRSTSALKYKKDIRDLETVNIDLFRAVRYKSKSESDDQTKDHFGIIADEVHDAGISELVNYGVDGEVEGFQYERLTVVLLKHCQEQQAIIADLRTELDSLKSEVTALKGQA